MPRRSRLFVLRSVFFCAFASMPLLAQTPVSGDASAAPSKPTATEPAQRQSTHLLANSNVKLGVGDLIEIGVFGVPDLNTKARVSSTGDVYLPLIDYVHVGDLTTDEAQELIQKRLEDGGFVRSPHVTIFVDESASQAITVVGEVVHPGPYSAIGERRLFDLLSMAGGLTDRAGRNIIITNRGESAQRVELQLPQNLAEDTQNNIEILPGDTIIVSRAGIVYVLGEVNKPGGYVLNSTGGVTMLRVIAAAGGPTHAAAVGGTKMLRRTTNGLQELPVPLKDLLRAKVADIPVQADDIIYVPASRLKTALNAGALLGTLGTAAIYRVPF